MSRRVLITVGEVSGDRNAAQFAQRLMELAPDCRIDGLGGPAMRQAGVTVHHDTVSRSAMGLRALLRAVEVKRLLNWTTEYYQKTPPDLHVCVDSWAMNCHFAMLAKRFKIPVLYYIAPQAWASRPGRVKKMRKCVDELACILPFEQQWFASRGVPTRFVGHPLFDHVAPIVVAAEKPLGYPPVVGILPGSRKSIARHNFPRQLDVAALLAAEIPGIRFLIATTPNTDAIVREELAHRNLTTNFTVELDGFDHLVPQCDLCLTVSGTATLHVAAYNIPMIIVYRGSWLAWNLLGRWIISARTFGMVNILSPDGRHIAPEFIPWNGSVKPVADCALDFLANPAKLIDQRRRLVGMIAPLAAGGASRKTAELALELIGRE